ncbi:hypothetical protein BDV96DRAFT_220881 [Lophiotrema nucula]|uniref:Uncharacterized protein n=1 Tax=Lophiotrema nucula TaxID=690887 RepID=A0A6A5YSJ4_9PLEO|nr:hypothetical protein BDV96DRAFT_220881 [Lophiotrema nucula]
MRQPTHLVERAWSFQFLIAQFLPCLLLYRSWQVKELERNACLERTTYMSCANFGAAATCMKSPSDCTMPQLRP